MSDFGFVAGVTGLFFLFGLAFGALAVIAASALRSDAQRAEHRRARQERDDTGRGAGWDNGWTDTVSAGWEEPGGPDEAGEDSPPPPRWPGGGPGGPGPSRR